MGGCGKTSTKEGDEVCVVGRREGFLEEELLELGPGRRTGIFHVTGRGEKDPRAEETA